MPARFEEGSGWIAHTENIDKWFQAYTRVSMKKAINSEEQKEEINGRHL